MNRLFLVPGGELTVECDDRGTVPRVAVDQFSRYWVKEGFDTPWRRSFEGEELTEKSALAMFIKT